MVEIVAQRILLRSRGQVKILVGPIWAKNEKKLDFSTALEAMCFDFPFDLTELEKELKTFLDAWGIRLLKESVEEDDLPAWAWF